MTPEVAIIHAGQDRQNAARLAKTLQRRGVNVWIDLEPLVFGGTPVESVKETLGHSRIIVYLISPAIMCGAWQDVEWAAMQHHLTMRENLIIIPVIVEPVYRLPFPLARFTTFDISKGLFEDGAVALAQEVSKLLAKRNVFLCLSSRDKEIVRRIVTVFREDSSIAVWYDEDALKPGSIIRRGIEVGISRADYLVAVLSTNFVDTIEGWIGFELDQAYERERKRNLAGHYFLIPAIVESGVNIPGWLATKVYVDLVANFDTGIRHLVDAIKVPIPNDETR